MPAIDVQIEGVEKLRSALARYPRIAPTIFAKAINASLAAVESQATDQMLQFRTPRALRTGRLRSSFATGRHLATPSNLVGSIGPTVIYAKFVEYGTQPHVIIAKNAKVLANRKTGQIFGKVVHHPGSRANPFMERLAAAATPTINKIMAEGLANIVSSLGI